MEHYKHMVRSEGIQKTDASNQLARFYHLEVEELRMREIAELLEAFRIYYNFTGSISNEGPDRR